MTLTSKIMRGKSFIIERKKLRPLNRSALKDLKYRDSQKVYLEKKNTTLSKVRDSLLMGALALKMNGRLNNLSKYMEKRVFLPKQRNTSTSSGRRPPSE